MQILKISLRPLLTCAAARSYVLAWAVLGFLWTCVQSDAQNVVLTMGASPSPVTVSNTLTYTLDLKNQTGITLQNVTVVDTLPSSVQFLSASNPLGSVSTNGNIITFNFVQLVFGQAVEMTIAVQPTQAGSIINIATASALLLTNSVSTNLTTLVTLPQAGLSVAMVGPKVPVFVNDWMSYQVIAGNGGPSDAPGVTLSNSLPAGVRLISVAPTNQVLTSTSGAVLLSLGTLTNGESRTFDLRVQPTNAGTLTFSSSILSSGVVNTNSANETASTNVIVGSFLSGLLTASNVSVMAYNPQTGLMDQKVRLSNIGTSAVASARVIVAGPTNWLYNAVGTNDGNPFVVYGAALEVGQSADLGLEYFVPRRVAISVPDTAYTAVEVPAGNVIAPSGTPFSITLVTNLASGAVLIEFQSIPGRSYTILYSPTTSFTNALVAQPPIVAPGDRVQWIDDGPPKTISAPANAASRFYKVILNR